MNAFGDAPSDLGDPNSSSGNSESRCAELEKERNLVRLYRALTGVNEDSARSVYMYLNPVSRPGSDR